MNAPDSGMEKYILHKSLGPWFLNKCGNVPLFCWSLHTTLLPPCWMKGINVPDINLLPTLLSSVHIIWWGQGLELLVGTISLMHTFCRWAWHSNQTCTSLKLTAVVNNQIYLFFWWIILLPGLMLLYVIQVASNTDCALTLQFILCVENQRNSQFLTFKLSK